MDLALLQELVGLRGLRHGEQALAAEPQRSGGEERQGLIEGFECPIRRGRRERNAQLDCVLVSERNHPRRTSGQGDGIRESAPARGVRHRVHDRADVADPINRPAP